MNWFFLIDGYMDIVTLLYFLSKKKETDKI